MPTFLLAIYDGSFFFYSLLLLIFIGSFYEIIKNVRQKKLVFFLTLIVIVFIYSFIKIRDNNLNNYILLIWVFSIVWISDISGYLVGKTIGGPKLTIYSPNKTISGFVGSVFFSQLSIIIPLYFIKNFHLNIKIIFLQFLLCLTAVFGDIFFSYVKRINHIKDYSNLIPGHGGILDRIDGLIFVIIIYNFINLFHVLPE